MFGGSGAQGFAALAAYDSNGDGVIDANDPIYSQLRLWVDGNHDGAVDAGSSWLVKVEPRQGSCSINLCLRRNVWAKNSIYHLALSAITKAARLDLSTEIQRAVTHLRLSLV
jgi:hypothetical protein